MQLIEGEMNQEIIFYDEECFPNDEMMLIPVIWILCTWRMSRVPSLLRWFCSSATKRIITAKDHSSVQLNIGHIDDSGIYTRHLSTFSLSGFVRCPGNCCHCAVNSN
ncbi:hypothetical protein C5167_026466 [Papaver somniferum]|nr:hypothetical protein C5167_026466 [Papaver somniferum]